MKVRKLGALCIDSVVLSQQQLSFGSTRFDQFIQCHALFAQRLADSIQRIGRNHLLPGDQHAFAGLDDTDEIAFLIPRRSRIFAGSVTCPFS